MSHPGHLIIGVYYYYYRYIAKKFKQESNVVKEYYAEQDKFLELIKTEEPNDSFDEARTELDDSKFEFDVLVHVYYTIPFVYLYLYVCCHTIILVLTIQ